MSIPIHIINMLAGSAPTQGDRLFVGIQKAVVTAVGGGADATVTTAIAFPTNALPPTYAVQVTPDQDCRWWITGRTQSGFNVVTKPIAGGTLAAGHIDVVVIA